MDCPHTTHRRPLPRQIQTFVGASRGSTPASTFFRTRSASDFATGASPEGTKLAPDDRRRNVLRCYTPGPHRDELPLGHPRHATRSTASTHRHPPGSNYAAECPLAKRQRRSEATVV